MTMYNLNPPYGLRAGDPIGERPTDSVQPAQVGEEVNSGPSSAARRACARRRVLSRYRTAVSRQLANPLRRPAPLAPRSRFDASIVSLTQSDPIGTRTLLETARRVPIEGPQFVTEFEKNCEGYSTASRQVEQLVRKIDSTPDTARARLAKLRSRLDALEQRVEILASQLFGAFARILGFPVNGPLKYDKRAMDTAIEACFGSLEKEGSNTFTFGPIQGWVVHDSVEVNRVFSLYLGRKVFCPVRSAQKASSLESFYTRVTSSPPETEDTQSVLAWLDVVSRLLFPPPDKSAQAPSWKDFPLPLHASGSTEVPRSAGGKRKHYYNPTPRDPSSLDDLVRPEAIYTGGKIRVITVDSARNLDYAWINQYMSRAIRSCRWSIFGRSVEDWLAQNPDFLRPSSSPYCSGDLESATDLFSGACARTVLRAVSDSLRLSEQEYARMCSFTTDSTFLKGLKLDFEKGVVPDTVEQTRGQLMGSILSFPILCLVSFACATHRTSVHKRVLDLYQKNRIPQARRTVRKYGGCGVNGDDVVHREDPDLWVRNVEAIGGKASRGKSLLSPWVFTVNSEVWSLAKPGAKEWVKPCSIRPSLLCAMLDGEWKPSSKDWMEYARNPILDPTLLSLPRAVLKPHLPPSLGGCGVEYLFDSITMRDVASTHEARKELKNFAGEWVYPTRSITGRLVPVDEIKEELAQEVKVKCVVSDVDTSAFQRMCYRDGYLDHGEEPPPSFSLLFRQAQKRFERTLPFLSTGDRAAIKRTYDRAWRLYENGQRLLSLPLSVARDFQTVECQQFDRRYPVLASHHASSIPDVGSARPQTTTYALTAPTPTLSEHGVSFPLCGLSGCQNPRRSAIGFFCAECLVNQHTGAVDLVSD